MYTEDYKLFLFRLADQSCMDYYFLYVELDYTDINVNHRTSLFLFLNLSL